MKLMQIKIKAETRASQVSKHSAAVALDHRHTDKAFQQRSKP
jgi:hypothetical protein